MTTSKLPSGNWRCRVLIGGKQISFTAPTKKEAEFKAYRYITENTETLLTVNSTVGEVLDAHITARAGALSPSTVISYNKIKRLYFLDLQNKKARTVTENDVQTAVSELSGKVSPKTVRNAYGLLRSALSAYVPDSVFKKIKLPQKKKSSYYIPPKEDVERLVRHLKGTIYELPVSLAAFCGLRRSEICALTVGDFDKQKKTVSISKAVVEVPEGGTVVKSPKTTDSERVVFCPDRVLALVPDGDDHERVYKGALDTIYNAMHYAFPVLHMKPFRLHDLRHFYCSTLIRLNIPLFYIRDSLGHSSEKMIQEIYGHVQDEGRQEFAERINDEFEKLSCLNRV